jgi:zinc protease
MLKLLFLIIGLASFCAQASDHFQLPIQKKILPNGITVLVHEKRDMPIISYHSWFKIGARDEVPGKTGLAHYFEHLMFTGTNKYPAGKFDSIMEGKGISYNAYTTNDETVYYELFPSNEFDFIVDMESDRLKNLEITKKEFERERKVILEERLKRLEDSIEGLMSKLIHEAIFKNHPYSNPVIGQKEDLENLKLSDANEFWKKHYVPSNLVISIAGDVDSNYAFKMIEKYYGDIPAGVHDENKFTPDKDLESDIKLELQKEIETEKITIAYKISKIGEKEAYAMDLIGHVLSGDKSSRLYKKLVLQKNLAQQVSAGAYNLLERGLFEINITLREKVNKAEVLTIIDQEIKNLCEKQLSEKELQRAQLFLLKELIGSMRSVQSRSRIFALNEASFGDYNRTFTDIDIYQKMTAADILEYAKKRFQNKHRVILELNKK